VSAWVEGHDSLRRPAVVRGPTLDKLLAIILAPRPNRLHWRPRLY
jgi:hypothetical protein